MNIDRRNEYKDHPVKVTLTDEELLYLSQLQDVSTIDEPLTKKSPKADKLRRIIDCAYKYMEELAPYLDRIRTPSTEVGYDPGQMFEKGFATEEFARSLILNGKFRAAVRFQAGDCYIHCQRNASARIVLDPCRLIVEAADPAAGGGDDTLYQKSRCTVIAVDAIHTVNIVNSLADTTLDYSPVKPETLSGNDYYLIKIA